MSTHPALAGLGSASVWGPSPACDLLDAVVAGTQQAQEQDSQATEMQQPLNFLLLGSGDARHILKTVARSWRHGGKTPLTFYVFEDQVPALARILLHWSILLSSSEELNFQDRIENFLELYGNGLVRGKAWHLLQKESTALIDLVCDGRGELSKLFDFSLMKMRQRDDLAFTLNFWRDAKKRPFDIKKLWDFRMRQYYGPRYDTRENAIDWDYHMKLVKMASIIHKKEFTRWRLESIAFEMRESDYAHVNRSLATVQEMVEQGSKVTKWGYFADIVTGPFVSHGIETENQDLLKTANNTHVKASQDVSEFNVSSYLFETLYHKKYAESEKVEDVASAVRDFVNSQLVRIVFLPCDFAFLATKKQFQGKFHGIHVAASMAHRMENITPLLAPEFGDAKPCVIAETAKFLLDLTEEQKKHFVEQIAQMAKKQSLTVEGTLRMDGIQRPDAAQSNGRWQPDGERDANLVYRLGTQPV